jgi:arylsulfatase
VTWRPWREDAPGQALLEGKGPTARHELFYFGGPTLGAVRLDEMKVIFIQQPGGWPGPKVQTDMPILVNIRQDPFERTPMLLGETSATGAWGYGNEFFGREAWRFVAVQEQVLKLAETAVEFPCRTRLLSTSKRPRGRSKR